jgi:DNA ligase-associated metallophosphoesterase
MTSSTWPLRICGEELLLHPERAVIWPRCHTVIVADTHFGKSSYFARHGIAVPAGTDDGDRERLERLLEDSSARRLVILGDFLHSPQIEGTAESERLKSWVEGVGNSVEIHVVAGNHDRGGPWTRPKTLQWWDAEWFIPPFRFIHEDEHAYSGGTNECFALSGHVHPVLRVRNGRKGVMQVPVFWQRQAGMILPSFGSFTGGFAVRPCSGQRIYAVASDAVVPIARG